jgi:hypothetical protein
MLFITAKACFKITILRIRAYAPARWGMREFKGLAGGVGHVRWPCVAPKKPPVSPMKGKRGCSFRGAGAQSASLHARPLARSEL